MNNDEIRKFCEEKVGAQDLKPVFDLMLTRLFECEHEDYVLGDAITNLIDRIQALESGDRDLNERNASMRVALELLENDMHQFGPRPCPTCDQVTRLVGRPFGCDAFRARREK